MAGRSQAVASSVAGAMMRITLARARSYSRASALIAPRLVPLRDRCALLRRRPGPPAQGLADAQCASEALMLALGDAQSLTN
jgi:hypothetical protein